MKLSKVKKYLPMIIGILLTIPLAVGAFFLTQGALTRAGSVAPTDIKVTQITASSAVVSWTTDKESTGVVEYGTSPSQMVFFAPEATAKSEHRVELTLLQSRTPYYYVIRIGDEVYNKDGIPYTFTTKGEGESVEQAPKLPGDPTIPPKVPANGSNSLPQGGPSPTAKLVLPSCIVTDDCAEIQKRFGKGCSTKDYLQCLRKKEAVQGVSTTNTTPTPTFIPAQRLSPTE